MANVGPMNPNAAAADGAPTGPDPSDGPGPVDWPMAARLAHRLVPTGPGTDAGEAGALVAELRASAALAAAHAARITGLRPADGSDPAAGVAQVLVVDRSGWARANTELLAALTAGVSGPGGNPPSQGARRLGAAQAGGVLAILAAKVLGQYDPFTRRPGPGGGLRGRLLLVAPNVLQVERELQVEPSDFRLWVALHEQTHALQFAAAPWLADHVRARTRALLTDLARGGPLEDKRRAQAFAALITRLIRGDDDAPGLDALLGPAERRLFEEVGAVMALLEGHADVAMDAVGAAVVPSVHRIRARFEARRSQASGRGPADRVLRRLLGLDLKLAQYRDGAAFVRAVTAAVGQDGLNAVWAGPGNLPAAREIADPRAWVRRVHG